VGPVCALEYRRLVPISHAKLPVGDLGRSRAFYAAALAPFGWRLVWEKPPVFEFGTGDGGEDDGPLALEVTEAPIAPCHIAFTATSRAQVDAFFAAAIAAGGSDNGPPGDRPYGAHYYVGFVLDPDGHNLEAVYKGE
jgi:catechol 2,3-dioxygenase-like lactoylglutathione lyase family enzyme